MSDRPRCSCDEGEPCGPFPRCAEPGCRTRAVGVHDRYCYRHWAPETLLDVLELAELRALER